MDFSDSLRHIWQYRVCTTDIQKPRMSPTLRLSAKLRMSVNLSTFDLDHHQDKERHEISSWGCSSRVHKVQYQLTCWATNMVRNSIWFKEKFIHIAFNNKLDFYPSANQDTLSLLSSQIYIWTEGCLYVSQKIQETPPSSLTGEAKKWISQILSEHIWHFSGLVTIT